MVFIPLSVYPLSGSRNPEMEGKAPWKRTIEDFKRLSLFLFLSEMRKNIDKYLEILAFISKNFSFGSKYANYEALS